MARKTFNASLVGMRFYKPSFDIQTKALNSKLVLEREPRNPHDSNAIAVSICDEKVGHINKDAAAIIAPLMDSGEEFKVVVGKFSKQSIGLQIISMEEYTSASPPTLLNGNSAGIYAINCGLSIYIGQSNNINIRLKSHWQSLSAGTHANKHMQKYWNEHGSHKLQASIIERPSADLPAGLKMQRWLAEREKHWIEHHKAKGATLNILDGDIVETKKAISDLEEEERAHDLWVKEEKKRINKEIESLSLKHDPVLLTSTVKRLSL